MATSKTGAKWLARRLGVEIVAGRKEITVEAPKGCHWVDGDVHELVASIWDDETMADLWDDILARMSSGYEECGADCEWWDK